MTWAADDPNVIALAAQSTHRLWLNEPVPHPTDVLAEQHGAKLLQPGGRSSSARMIVSRLGLDLGEV